MAHYKVALHDGAIEERITEFSKQGYKLIGVVQFTFGIACIFKKSDKTPKEILHSDMISWPIKKFNYENPSGGNLNLRSRAFEEDLNREFKEKEIFDIVDHVATGTINIFFEKNNSHNEHHKLGF